MIIFQNYCLFHTLGLPLLTCVKKVLPCTCPHTHTHTHIYIYIYKVKFNRCNPLWIYLNNLLNRLYPQVVNDFLYVSVSIVLIINCINSHVLSIQLNYIDVIYSVWIVSHNSILRFNLYEIYMRIYMLPYPCRFELSSVGSKWLPLA